MPWFYNLVDSCRACSPMCFVQNCWLLRSSEDHWRSILQSTAPCYAQIFHSIGEPPRGWLRIRLSSVRVWHHTRIPWREGEVPCMWRNGRWYVRTCVLIRHVHQGPQLPTTLPRKHESSTLITVNEFGLSAEIAVETVPHWKWRGRSQNVNRTWCNLEHRWHIT